MSTHGQQVLSRDDAVSRASGAEHLMERTVCLQLALGRFGDTRAVDKRLIEVDADKSELSISKRLLRSEQLEAIRKHDSGTRRHVWEHSLPSPLRAGLYLVPLDMLVEIDAWLEARCQERDVLIRAFVEVYEQQVEEARAILRDVYNAADYPGTGQVRRSFSWDVRYLSFSTPSSLRSLSRGIFDREKEKARATLVGFVDEMKGMLAGQFRDLVDHMQDRLTPDAETGKRKIFRGTLVDGLADFLSTLPSRLNAVGGSDEISALAAEARGLISGVDATTLKENESLRAQTAQAFGSIRDRLDATLTDLPSRRVRFEEEQ